MNRSNDDREKLKAITVRLPQSVYATIRDCATSRGVSMNMVVSDAISEYGVKVSRREALERIRHLHERQRERRGPTSDSVELLREMRAKRSEMRGESGK
jgi:hypothetical protein